MGKLTWDNITIPFTNLDLINLYSQWDWLLVDTFKPILMSTFGDLFFSKKDNRVYFLDTLTGSVELISNSINEFETFINNIKNQEKYLQSILVQLLREKNMVLDKAQCYYHKVPPILGGSYETSNIEIINLSIGLSMLGQMHKKLKEVRI